MSGVSVNDYNIADNLPESLNRTNLKEVAQVIDEHMHELNMLTEVIGIYYRIDELSSEFINELAIQFHVDFYDTTYELEKRRALVKNSIRWHMRKGTKGIVQELIQTVFNAGVITEWFEYGGDPYYFRISEISSDTFDADTMNEVIRAINTVKNVRSWLEGIGFKRIINSGVYWGGAISANREYHIGPPVSHDSDITDGTYWGGSLSTYREVIINE